MTILEDAPVLASIDSVFDDDHFVCCEIEDSFSGVTTGFCGAPVMLDGTEQEWVDEVGCSKCTKVSNDVDYCPLKGRCTYGDRVERP